jgi:signal transduction histidine kinase
VTEAESVELSETRRDVADRFAAFLASVRLRATSFSVRTKILGIILTLTVILGLGVTAQVRGAVTAVLVGELENRGVAVASDIAARSADPILLSDPLTVYEILRDTVSNHPDAEYAFVVGPAGGVVVHTFGDEGFPTALLDAYETPLTEPAQQRFESQAGAIHDFQAPILSGSAGAVRLGMNEDRLHSVVNGITIQMLATTVLVALVGVAAASLLTWLLTRPILDLVKTTREVGDGDLTARASYWADDEIGALAVAFNQMVVDLESNQATIAKNEVARTRLLEQLMIAQEEERKRISRELHDTVGQSLSSIMVEVAVLRRSAVNESSLDNRVLDQLLQDSLDQVRQMSRDLRPSALDDLGLSAALDLYAQDFQIQYPAVAVDLHTSLAERVTPVVETAIYRIVQEAMTNAGRHSDARTVSVLIAQRNATVKTIIEDNGSGFNRDEVVGKRRTVGLHAMRERAEILGGRFAIESGEDGTTVYVEVPL